MNTAIVTIFKSELEYKPASFQTELFYLCSDVKEIGDAYVYSPKAGELFDFLSVLKFNKIAHGSHFEYRLDRVESK